MDVLVESGVLWLAVGGLDWAVVGAAVVVALAALLTRSRPTETPRTLLLPLPLLPLFV